MGSQPPLRNHLRVCGEGWKDAPTGAYRQMDAGEAAEAFYRCSDMTAPQAQSNAWRGEGDDDAWSWKYKDCCSGK